MRHDPLVTVVVPVWNAGDRLHACLESIRAQTYANLEVLCIDDGCTDGSSSVMASIAARDGRFRVIQSGGRVGEGAARNLGLDSSRGEYVAFVDADDRISANALELLVDLAERSGSDLVRGSVITEYPWGIEHEAVWQSVAPVERASFGDVPATRIPWGMWSYLFRRELIERLGLRFSRFAVGADAIFLVEAMLAANHVSMVAEVTYRYSQTPPSIRRSWEQQVDSVAHVAMIRERLLDGGHERVWLESCGPFFASVLVSNIAWYPGLVGRIRLARAARSALVGAGATPIWVHRAPFLEQSVLGPWRVRINRLLHSGKMHVLRAPYRVYRALPESLQSGLRSVRGRSESESRTRRRDDSRWYAATSSPSTARAAAVQDESMNRDNPHGGE